MVRRIELLTTGHSPRSSLIDPQLVASCDYQDIPTHFARALSSSKLNHITELVVINYPSQKWTSPTEFVARCLRNAIEEVYPRNNDRAFIPRLTLGGFDEEKSATFSDHWEIVTAGAVNGPGLVMDSGIFATAALSSDHTDFGFFAGQDEAIDSDSS